MRHTLKILWCSSALVLLVVLGACAAPSTPAAPTTSPPTATFAPTATVAATPFVSDLSARPSPTPEDEAIICVPTPPNADDAFYQPNAPVRASVGQGHVLRGVVRSARTCAPLTNARLEFWLANASGIYDDAHRATVFTDANGAYRFESAVPTPDADGRARIRVRVSADGHRPLITQYVLRGGEREATFDLVLAPY